MKINDVLDYLDLLRKFWKTLFLKCKLIFIPTLRKNIYRNKNIKSRFFKAKS